MSIRTNSTDRRRASPWLAAGAFVLSAGSALHADPAAKLLPPQRLPVIARASAEEVVPIDPAPPVIKARERPPGFKYPTPYTKEETGGFTFANLWDRVSGRTIEPSPAAPPKAQNAVAKGAHKPGPEAPTAVVPIPVAVAPPTPSPEVPAWRWFGYGAPVPGSNPYAPAGVYAPVNPGFYFQTGSTPGAIPQPLLPLVPVLPEPMKTKNTEPSALMLRPLPNGIDDRPPVEPTDAGTAPASLELPVPAPKPEADVVAPLMARPVAPIARGRAPLPQVTDQVVDALRQAATGYAERVEIEDTRDGRLLIQAKLLPGMLADRLANRISALPELREFQVQMQFDR